jgi:fructose-1,6-bisphosphatase/inositol monophosphatase family enzyme
MTHKNKLNPVIAQLDSQYIRYIDAAFKCTNSVRRKIWKSIKDGTAFERAVYTAPDGTQKTMLAIDKAAENNAIDFLKVIEDLAILGEETLWQHPDLDLTKQQIIRDENGVRLKDFPEKRITAIIDMVDGSDLMERKFGNWCSAMVFLRMRPTPKIMLSLIHNDNGEIYIAHDGGCFVFSAPLDISMRPTIVKLVSPEKKSLPEETSQISICYYGQKHGHFSTIPNSLYTWASSTEAKDRLRFYNFGGNPMMARLANGENIHAVFEHIGQLAHDAVPGLFLAKQAGAYVCDLGGEEITSEMLATYLLRPSRAKLKYVVASTQELAKEITRAVGTTRLYYRCPKDISHPGDTAPRESAPVCRVCQTKLVVWERRGLMRDVVAVNQ